MNPKIQKLREERQRNSDKIDSLKEKMDALKARNKKIDEEIRAEENLEIRGMMDAYNMTPEQLAAFLAGARGDAPSVLQKEVGDE